MRFEVGLRQGLCRVAKGTESAALFSGALSTQRRTFVRKLLNWRATSEEFEHPREAPAGHLREQVRRG